MQENASDLGSHGYTSGTGSPGPDLDGSLGAGTPCSSVTGLTSPSQAADAVSPAGTVGTVSEGTPSSCGAEAVKSVEPRHPSTIVRKVMAAVAEAPAGKKWRICWEDEDEESGVSAGDQEGSTAGLPLQQQQAGSAAGPEGATHSRGAGAGVGCQSVSSSVMKARWRPPAYSSSSSESSQSPASSSGASTGLGQGAQVLPFGVARDAAAGRDASTACAPALPVVRETRDAACGDSAAGGPGSDDEGESGRAGRSGVATQAGSSPGRDGLKATAEAGTSPIGNWPLGLSPASSPRSLAESHASRQRLESGADTADCSTSPMQAALSKALEDLDREASESAVRSLPFAPFGQAQDTAQQTSTATAGSAQPGGAAAAQAGGSMGHAEEGAEEDEDEEELFVPVGMNLDDILNIAEQLLGSHVQAVPGQVSE